MCIIDRTDRHTYRQTDIHTYRQTDRQTDRHRVQGKIRMPERDRQTE